MREILFRAKPNATNEWVYGDLVSHRNKSPKNGKFIGVISTIPTKHYEIHRVKTNTLGQYTGLKDKNGTKIFEGDIFGDSSRREIDVVVFEDGCFQLKSYGYIEYCLDGNAYEEKWSECDCQPICNFCLEHDEILGNIYDNPELLEGDNVKD